MTYIETAAIRIFRRLSIPALALVAILCIFPAVSEAAMNAAVHAGGGRARIHGQSGHMQVWIEDRGRGIDLHSLPRATLERGYTTANTLGHGFFMVLTCADRVHLLTGPAGTTVVIEQFHEPPQPAWLTHERTGLF